MKETTTKDWILFGITAGLVGLALLALFVTGCFLLWRDYS